MSEMKVMEAAKRYGLHPSYLGFLLRMGAIEGRKDSLGRWLVKTASVRAYLSEPPKRGRRTQARDDSKTEVVVGA